LPNPVSFRQVTGREFPVVDLAKELCGHLQDCWSILLQHPDQVTGEYNEALYRRGEKVKLRQENRVFEARIDGVNQNGQLEVFTVAPETFNFGEVSWIL